MTINEAINRIDSIKPNSFTQSEKIRWLSTLDGVVKKEIIDTHEGGRSFKEYTEDDLNTELLIPAPYDEVYIRWLESRIDYSDAEYGRYNNSLTAFNDAYSAYEKYYNRTNMPVQRGKFKF